MEAAIAVASSLLYQWSGQQFRGCCSTLVRPQCRPGSIRGPAFLPWDAQAWPLFGIDGGRGMPLGCCAVQRVRLAGYPIRDIIEVQIDGAVIDPATYRLDMNRYLTRVGHLLFWPSNQHLDLALGDVGTWSVEYEFGADPPPEGLTAANALACQFVLACATGTCELPASVTRIARQGLTIERLNYTNIGAKELRIAVPAVDLFLLANNPSQLQARGAVFSNDVQRFPMRVGPIEPCVEPGS